MVAIDPSESLIVQNPERFVPKPTPAADEVKCLGWAIVDLLKTREQIGCLLGEVVVGGMIMYRLELRRSDGSLLPVQLINPQSVKRIYFVEKHVAQQMCDRLRFTH